MSYIRVEEIHCPFCIENGFKEAKKLAEWHDNRFETINGAEALRIHNEAAIMIKCPRCRAIVDVLAAQERLDKRL